MNNSSPSPAVGVSGFSGTGFRLEIQALRAIAVLAVLVFHIWPDALSGGYVGVDVFFVISGYLITGILYRQFSTTGRIRVSDFYVRRIRRLLPAAAAVLVAVAFLLPLLPRTQWNGNVAGIAASALYVQNWWLSGQAVDYLAAESAPSAVMHFWSLSVEEQYYIGWPLLLMLVALLPAGWRKHPGRVFASLVTGVVVLSLAYSVWLTNHNPPLAYFSTLTRAWELGIGGLLAVTVRWRALPLVVRELAQWIGLAMIAIAVFTYTKATPFPGYTAALPVVGTALVLIGGESGRWFSAYNILRRTPFQYLGDISYSLYLWHWPVIIFYAAIAGRTPGALEGVALFVVSCALAYHSKVFIEDRFRFRASEPKGHLRAFGIAAGCIVLSLAAAWAAPRPWSAGSAQGGDGAPQTEAPTGTIPNPGAAALTQGMAVPDAAILPDPRTARDDVPAPYQDRCMSRGDSTAVKVCHYGNQASGYRVALVGDTYAAQWQPAMLEIARANDWALDVVVKTTCALGAVPQGDSGEKHAAVCREWRRKLPGVVEKLSPNIVLVAQSPTVQLAGVKEGSAKAEALATGLISFAREIGDVVDGIAFIRSTPSMGADCRKPESLATCSRTRKEATRDLDPILSAAKKLDGAYLVDLTDAICTETACDAVVGNVAVYRGASHLTATYSRSLAPPLAKALADVGVIENIKAPSIDMLPVPTDLPQRAVAAKRDNPALYADGCHADQVEVEPTYCVYGDRDSKTRIALIGDSHAAQWLPPLREIAQRNGWAVYTFTKSACAFSDATVQVGGREYTSCTSWNAEVMGELEKVRPSLVVTSQSRGQIAFGKRGEASQAELARGLLGRWADLRSGGVPVVVIADTPWMREDIPDCLSAPRFSQGACDTPFDIAVRSPDSILRAMESHPDVEFLNLNEHICEGGNCPAIRDGGILWRDRHHLTATYARSLAPLIEPTIEQALGKK